MSKAIPTLKFSVTSTELAKHCNNRAAHHSIREEYWRQKADASKGEVSELEDRTEEPNAYQNTMMVAKNQLDHNRTMQQQAAKMKRTFFKYAKHFIKGTYELTHNELQTLEFFE
jgi:hypothetical protein